MQSPAQTSRSGGSPHIAVVGAGLAGLRCTDILLRHGFKVTIIEARSRIGGRVHQTQLSNGSWVDMGPNWIHGTEDNPFMDLAKETQTALSTWDDGSLVFNETGVLFSADEGKKYSDLMWQIVEEAFEHSNKLFADIPASESLWDFFQKKAVEKFPDAEDGYQEKRKILLQISELWGAYVGSSITKQSLKFFWLEECIEGENLFCASTYKKILDLIAKPALDGAELRLNTTAERITYGVEPKASVDIQISGGQSLRFDGVVVTSPLGWLKRNLSIFEPPLPVRLTAAIDSIAWGDLEKVYITFPAAFWRRADNEGEKVDGLIQWLSPNYAPDLNPQRWNQVVFELASLTPETSHPTLLFYTYGDQAAYLIAKVAELPTQKEKEDFIFAYFKPYYSRLPFYSESVAECQPTEFRSTDWLHDDLAGNGSYTNFQSGLKRGGEDVETLRHGVPDQGLWLAGEHTAPFVALGTATGAYWSGEAVAHRIVEAYKGKTSTA